MSVHLIYFERNQLPVDGNYAGFKEVNNYSLPNFCLCEDITVIQKCKDIRVTIFFDGISSNNFYSFSNSRKGEYYRAALFDFISDRIKNRCIQAYLFFTVLNGKFLKKIVLPDKFEMINLEKLESIFASRIFNGLFQIA